MKLLSGRGPVAAAMTAHALAGCAAPEARPESPAPAPADIAAAGLAALDALAPLLGGGAGRGDCDARYAAEALRVRCAALAADPAALAPDLALLEALAHAGRAEAALEAEFYGRAPLEAAEDGALAALGAYRAMTGMTGGGA